MSGGADTKEFGEAMKNAASFDAALREIEQILATITADELSLKDVSNQIPHVDSAKMYAGLAYTLDSLFHMYLKTQGVNAATHPVRKELERVKKYIEKITEATKKPEVNPMRVDKGAAGRFIRAALSGEGKDSAEDGPAIAGSAGVAALAAAGVPHVSRPKAIPNFAMPRPASLRNPNPSLATTAATASPVSSPPASPLPAAAATAPRRTSGASSHKGKDSAAATAPAPVAAGRGRKGRAASGS